ncbi:MAG TPA: DUF4254 domain-containing protein [Gemmatimonadaceae bacterium]
MKLAALETAFQSYEQWSIAWDTQGPLEFIGFDPLLPLVERLHRFNYDLWNQEDIARRIDVPDRTIREVKRSIDRLNQQRNDAIEALDEWLLATFYERFVHSASVIRTETPGSALDRLSILSLKILRMRQQTERAGVTCEHVVACTAKLDVLLAQRDDLRASLRLMISELNNGSVRMRVYRQFKMYNDPTLNPQLYRRHGVTREAAV